MTGEADGPAVEDSAPDAILVVDADVLVRLAVSTYLRECGYKVSEASGLHEAMLILQQTQIAIDVVLSDVTLGDGQEGFILARWIRANRGELDVILVASPERAAETAKDLCEEGPLVTKPYDHHLLAARIRQLRASRRKASPDAGKAE